MLHLIRKAALILLFITQIAQALSPNVIDLDDYRGFVVSGDWTDAIQRAVNDLPATGGTVLFPAGEHLYQSSWIQITNKSNFIIDGNGSTVEYAASTPVTGGFGGFAFQNANNFVFKNLTIDGNRDQRSPAETYAHSVFIIGGSNYTLENINVKDAVVDGFYIVGGNQGLAETYPINGTILNCSSISAYRQGMSIINAINLNIIGGNYSGTNGTAPEAGIDIEANPVTGLTGSRNIRIQSTTLEGNEGFGLLVSGVGNPTDISVRDSHFSADKKGAIYIAGGDVTVSGNSFVDFSEAIGGIVSLDADSTAARLSITDNHFRAITAEMPAIVLKGQGEAGDTVISGNTFHDVYSVLSTYKRRVVFNSNTITDLNGTIAALALQSSYSHIFGNSFNGTQRYAIWINGDFNRVVDNTITDHVFPDSQDWGVIRIASGDNEVRGNWIRTSPGDTIHRAIRNDSTISTSVGGNRCSGYSTVVASCP